MERLEVLQPSFLKSLHSLQIIVQLKKSLPKTILTQPILKFSKFSLLIARRAHKNRLNINTKLSLEEKEEIKKLRSRIYYIKNKEKIKECYIKANYNNEENKAIISAKSRAYYKKNKEKIALRTKAYNQNNKEKITARKKAYNQNNKEQVSRSGKLYYQKNRERICKKSANDYLKRVANKWKPAKEKKNTPTCERPTETKIKKKDLLKKETSIGPEINVN